MTECIITGVVLVYDGPEGLVIYNGDLFRQGDTFIVNCNEQSARPIVDSWPAAHHDVKWVITPKDTWERRGVFVFPAIQGYLSKAAQEYIA